MSALVLVVALHPRHRTTLVASLRSKIEIVIGADERIQTPLVHRVRPEDLALLILIEKGDAGLGLATQFLHGEVVEYGTRVEVLAPERCAHVVAEVVTV